MDKIFIKPLNDARYTEPEFPDWIFYQTGQFGKPEFILTERNMHEIVKEYCKFHKIEVDWHKDKK